MMPISRRGFVGGALAFGTCGVFSSGFGETALPGDGNGKAYSAKAARLKFGVVSDIHIGGKPDAADQLEKVLRWFASENVDAVLCPGDIAHSGLIGELEKFAEVWHRVFPGNEERGTGSGLS